MEKKKIARVIVPGIFSQKQIIGLFKFYDSKVTKNTRKGFKKRLKYGKSVVSES